MSVAHSYDQTKPAATARQMSGEELINELQSNGVRLVDPKNSGESRRGGRGSVGSYGPDNQRQTVMIPVHTAPAFSSPYVVDAPDAEGNSRVRRDGVDVGRVKFPFRPKFYDCSTADGIPYSHIAALHSKDVLATTILQTCIRYQSRTKTCKFCSIGQSLAAGRTIERKTPEQLGEVAKAAVELDGVTQMIMTTGTPPTKDRGAAILCESAEGVKARVDLPIQGQCEPPDKDAWFQRMKDAGIDSLGMHLEAVSEEVRAEVMPGKAQVSVERYFEAFEAAVEVFGRGEVSTYILAGLGDSKEQIIDMSERLIKTGVYPFVVPFVPISGTPMESHPTPSAGFMHEVLMPIGKMLRESGIKSEDMAAGCAKCGACSALSLYEKLNAPAG